MGNTPSRSDAANRSGGNNNNGGGGGGGGGGGSDGGNAKGGGSVFRLPLYRGGRDAFLPTMDDGRADDDDDDDVVAGDDDGASGRGGSLLPPPRRRRPPPPPVGEMTEGEMSPPSSVTSTSCDSSYATQDVSPASGGGNKIGRAHV